MRDRQLSFLPPQRLCHGGEIRKGKRKLARPVDTRRPMHVVMCALQARGAWSMLARRNKSRIFVLTRETAERHGVRIYRFSNVGNHLHLLVRVPSRQAWRAFIRALSGAIAFHVTGARKGVKLRRRFWDLLAFSRVVSWGREFRSISLYFVKNQLESLGIPREDQFLARGDPRG